MAHGRGTALALAGVVVAATQVVATGASPSPTTDRPWIVYNGATDAGSGIRLVRTDGSDDHASFKDATGGEQWHPDWSPDGGSIAFAADQALTKAAV